MIRIVQGIDALNTANGRTGTVAGLLTNTVHAGFTVTAGLLAAVAVIGIRKEVHTPVIANRIRFRANAISINTTAARATTVVTNTTVFVVGQSVHACAAAHRETVTEANRQALAFFTFISTGAHVAANSTVVCIAQVIHAVLVTAGGVTVHTGRTPIREAQTHAVQAKLTVRAA